MAEDNGDGEPGIPIKEGELSSVTFQSGVGRDDGAPIVLMSVILEGKIVVGVMAPGAAIEMGLKALQSAHEAWSDAALVGWLKDSEASEETILRTFRALGHYRHQYNGSVSMKDGVPVIEDESPTGDSQP